MACRDCKNCTNSALAHAGRKWGRRLAAVSTGFASEAVMATQKKCRECGHQMSLHGTDQVGSAVQPTVQIQQQPQAAPPGWYYIDGPDRPPRWWDGTAWRP